MIHKKKDSLSRLDVACWSLDRSMHTEHPSRVMSLGGRFVWYDQGETPNTQFSVAEYPNGQKVIMYVRIVDYDDYERLVENRFYFEDGGKNNDSNYTSPNGEILPLELEKADIYPGENIGSFVRACRAGDPAMVNAGMLEGHYSSALGHLMNISYRLGQEKPFSEDVVAFTHPEVDKQFKWFHSVMRDGVGLGGSARRGHPPSDNYRVGPWLTFDSGSEKFAGDFAANANVLLRNPNRTGFKIPEADKV